jgi:hypothetical protein
LKKYAVYLPTVALLLTALANAATPAISAFWINHAGAAAIFAPLAVIVAHWLPSPYASAKSQTVRASSLLTDQGSSKP